MGINSFKSFDLYTNHLDHIYFIACTYNFRTLINCKIYFPLDLFFKACSGHKFENEKIEL